MDFSRITAELKSSAENLARIGKNLDDKVLKPLKKSADRVRDGLDALKRAKELMTDLVEDISGDVSLESLKKTTSDFDADWDRFDKAVNKAFYGTSSEGRVSILNELARKQFGDKVFAAGSLIKNESPGIFGGLAQIKEGLDSLGGASDGKLLEKVRKVRGSIEKVVEGVEQLDKSLDNVFSAVTVQLGADASALTALQGKLRNLVKGMAGSPAVRTVLSAADRLQTGIDVQDAGRVMVESLLRDASGAVTIESLAAAAKNFDANWDRFAEKVNNVFRGLPGSGKMNILEHFAKSAFGENVFYAGSAIKKEMPGVLGGIADFRSALGTFAGSYRDPVEAACKIKTGTERMIKAVERTAGSLNSLLRRYRGKGNVQEADDVPLLKELSGLSETRGIRALNTALRIGGGAAAVAGNAGGILKSIREKDVRGIVSGVRKMAGDFRTLTKDNLRRSEKNSEEERDEKPPKDGGQASASGSYVASTALLTCTFGSMPAKLKVYPDRTVYLAGKPMANISDHIPSYNIPSFGMCRSLANPKVEAATAAAHGVLTPRPCTPNTTMPWMGGKRDYLIKGQPALLKSCTCMCRWAGKISIIHDGQ